MFAGTCLQMTRGGFIRLARRRVNPDGSDVPTTPRPNRAHEHHDAHSRRDFHHIFGDSYTDSIYRTDVIPQSPPHCTLEGVNSASGRNIMGTDAIEP